VNVSDLAPDFTLEDTSGERHSPEGVTAVVFTCNHCPYALAWHDRLLDVARDYEGRARVLLVNPNDPERYPADSPEASRERVERDGGWPAPYLLDTGQEVARGYGAEKTPDVFLLDAERRVRYRGAPDADYEDPSQGAAWLREALDAVLDGRDPDRPETPPVGCSVKWKT
jgi:hypothetical protein